ncbi:MAG TPA: hypothetical protein DEO65_09995 [Bacillus bacterium]|uniref:Ribosomal protein S18 n=1 Tax=Siminovitchia fordii TaxID=254759 RepID=A0ABQ4K283_9BACI|nr:hypothetical protein [Siminovitchia fordii]GIN19203.1 hypothetical protein J1TS3_03370 [Siminovitchia fordii]HBZ10195.1 hypothetical protein [Bacillus sp. (in: firmicutes)]
MGYITPIKINQYTEYQKRDQEKEKTRDPIPVHFTPRIRFQPKFQSGATAAVIQLKNKGKSGAKPRKNRKFTKEKGKGRYLNEYV